MEFQRLTVPNVPLLAPRIRRFMHGDAEWMAANYPETFAGYATYPGTLRRLFRVAFNPNIATIIGTRGRTVRTIGTVGLTPSVVYYPDLETGFTGRHIDYRADAGLNTDEHIQTVHALATFGGYEGQVLATLTAADQERATGIATLMQPVGGSTRLTVGPLDPFGLGDMELQLYTADTTELVRRIGNAE